MSQHLNYKQATNVERRKWDREHYEAKANARVQQIEQDVDGSLLKGTHGSVTKKRTRELESLSNQATEEEFLSAPKDAVGPELSDRAYLKARKGKVNIDSKIGLTEIISAEAATKSTSLLQGNERSADGGIFKVGVGWHCKVCDCFLKDSHTYLDHINGRKHQRKLGYSMRIERSTKEQVQERLQILTQRQQQQNQTENTLFITETTDELREKDEEQMRRLREERIRRRQEKKKKVEENVDPEDSSEGEVDPNLAAMMGFSGFGGARKS
jgi:U4/U6.U5 tri-snRNP component SNU23